MHLICSTVNPCTQSYLDAHPMSTGNARARQLMVEHSGGARPNLLECFTKWTSGGAQEFWHTQEGAEAAARNFRPHTAGGPAAAAAAKPGMSASCNGPGLPTSPAPDSQVTAQWRIQAYSPEKQKRLCCQLVQCSTSSTTPAPWPGVPCLRVGCLSEILCLFAAILCAVPIVSCIFVSKEHRQAGALISPGCSVDSRHAACCNMLRAVPV